MELSELQGVGKARLEAMHAAGIFSLRDLLFAVPFRYRDVSQCTTIESARPGERAALHLRRVEAPKLARFGKQCRVTCTFEDHTGCITCCWFNQSWRKEQLTKQTSYLFYGLVEIYGRHKQLVNPSVETEQRIIPLYRPIEGLPQKTHQNLISQVLSLPNVVEELCGETLPSSLSTRYGLMPCAEAIRALHAPQDMQIVTRAQHRLAFEQALLHQAAVRMLRGLRKQGIRLSCPPAKINAFWRTLPFSPTDAQRRTLDEIAEDLRSDRAMTRMVQGDVGSGKTAIAMGAMLLCAQNGYQSVLMAPTEILARQHYHSLKRYFEGAGFGCGLLVGGMPAAQRRETLSRLADGSFSVMIGTHALLAKTVQYRNLALCITDEQHRFGVSQRTSLLRKGADTDVAPHLLVMSATPIPRSLALVLYGDMDVSVLDELPPGRLPVQTRIVADEKREAMYRFLRKELEQGKQAYIVCPLVEDSEQEDGLKSVQAHFDALQKGLLQGLTLGLTHGRQNAMEKEAILQAFAAGDVQALVSTTVIEVGVNVPNATVMIIESAERYGLAQLHQLRGRVGRGAAESWCFLVGKENERLRVLAQTSDGFEIARKDLELRGAGELLGTRQHGQSDLTLVGGAELIYSAAQCAKELEEDPALGEEWTSVQMHAGEYLDRCLQTISIS